MKAILKIRNTLIKLTVLLLLNSFSYSQCLSSISCGRYHAIGMKEDGTVYTWGNGGLGWGALGNGSNFDNYIPTQVVTMTNVQKVFRGNYNTFAIKNNGTLWATGDNVYGQLGNGTFGFANVSYTFIPIGTATNWKEISANSQHTIGLRTNGTLWAWGNNEYGSVGDGTATNWKTVATCISASFGIKTDGSLWCWGENTGLVLGLGDSAPLAVYTPTQVGIFGVYDTDWDKIAGGPSSAHVLAIKNNGALYSWGGWFTIRMFG